ncbi:MAG: response regulator transcription factor [Oscillospiraceae bacterium]|jgi:DNA-binding NarL/FixJ family response regulator
MRIVVVDDHPLARKGIMTILEDYMKDCVISEETCVEGALNALKTEPVSIMFVDLKLREEHGLDVIEEGRKISPETKFIIITTYMTAEEFKRAEKLGVCGYASKGAAPEDLVYITNLIMRGKKYYDSDLISYVYRQERADAGTAQLTEREMEVLLELGKGLSNEEIGKTLFISVNTVKKHISSIMSKLNLERRTQLVLYIDKLYRQQLKGTQRF